MISVARLMYTWLPIDRRDSAPFDVQLSPQLRSIAACLALACGLAHRHYDNMQRCLALPQSREGAKSHRTTWEGGPNISETWQRRGYLTSVVRRIDDIVGILLFAVLS